MTERDIDDILDDSTSIESEDTNIPKQLRNVFTDDSGIGIVTTQNEPARVGRQAHNINAYIDSEHRSEVKVGDYVQIPYIEEDETVLRILFGVVTQISYGRQRDFTDQLDGGFRNRPGEHELTYVATIQPISTIKYNPTEENAELQSQPVDAPPRPQTPVKTVSRNDILQTGLSLPDSGRFLGYMAVSNTVIPDEDNPLNYYLFDPNKTDGNSDEGEPVIFRHALIAGSTGQGKTHFSKNLLRQFAECKEYEIEVPPEEENPTTDIRERAMNLCIIDPEDEYTEMQYDGDIDSETKKKLERRGIQYGGLVNDPNTSIELFMPVDRETRNRTINNAQPFGIPFSLVRGRPELLMPTEPQGPTRHAIQRTLSSYFNQESKEPTYARFKSWADDYIQDEIEKGNLNENVGRAVKTRVINSTHERVFDQGPVTLDDITKSLVTPGQVTVIPTGHLRGEVDNFIVLCLLAHLIENKIGSNVKYPHIKGTPLLLALDEAHEYVSYPESQREHFIVKNMRQAARRGRKDKMGLFMITQNPQDVDMEIRNQINTNIYLGLERTVIDSSDVYVPPEFASQLPRFDKGQAVVKQPNVRPVEIKGLPVCLTRHTN